MHAVVGILRPLREVIQIALVVAVYQVHRQTERDDGVEGRGSHQIAAMNHGRQNSLRTIPERTDAIN